VYNQAMGGRWVSLRACVCSGVVLLTTRLEVSFCVTSRSVNIIDLLSDICCFVICAQ
jgi:hypothetical protein